MKSLPQNNLLPQSLEELIRYKIELKHAIREQQTALKESFGHFRTPTAGLSSVGRFASNFTWGLTLFEGAIFGWKIIRIIRKFFRK